MATQRMEVRKKLTPSGHLQLNWHKNGFMHDKKHHNNILEFFKDMPEKRIIVDISKQNWMDWLCECLELKISPDMIKSNVRHRKQGIIDRVINIVNTTFEELEYDQEQRTQSLVNNEDIKNFITNYKNNL